MDVEMKQHSYSRHGSQRGMTLLEVLVSLLVFSLGILGMVGLQARAVQYSVDAEDRTRAALIANEAIATMWMQKSTTLSTTTLAALQAKAASVAAGGLPNVTIAASTPSTGGATTVTITWKSPSKKASDPSSTYVTQVAMP
jgi:type IV pilus assembly protein PilV